jgi:hypothetical protein
MALLVMMLAGIALASTGGLAWRRGLAAFVGAPSPRTPAAMPTTAPRRAWDITSLSARADELDARDRH